MLAVAAGVGDALCQHVDQLHPLVHQFAAAETAYFQQVAQCAGQPGGQVFRVQVGRGQALFQRPLQVFEAGGIAHAEQAQLHVELFQRVQIEFFRIAQPQACALQGFQLARERCVVQRKIDVGQRQRAFQRGGIAKIAEQVALRPRQQRHFEGLAQFGRCRRWRSRRGLQVGEGLFQRGNGGGFTECLLQRLLFLGTPFAAQREAAGFRGQLQLVLDPLAGGFGQLRKIRQHQAAVLRRQRHADAGLRAQQIVVAVAQCRAAHQILGVLAFEAGLHQPVAQGGGHLGKVVRHRERIRAVQCFLPLARDLRHPQHAAQDLLQRHLRAAAAKAHQYIGRRPVPAFAQLVGGDDKAQRGRVGIAQLVNAGCRTRDLRGGHVELFDQCRAHAVDGHRVRVVLLLALGLQQHDRAQRLAGGAALGIGGGLQRIEFGDGLAQRDPPVRVHRHVHRQLDHVLALQGGCGNRHQHVGRLVHAVGGGRQFQHRARGQPGQGVECQCAALVVRLVHHDERPAQRQRLGQ